VSDLQNRLGYQFKDVGLLRLALTHPSVSHEQGNNAAHNQRLEFLGDAVLQLVISRELYHTYPSYGEGPLTKARANLVNRKTLATQAQALGLGKDVVLSRGEDLSGGRERPSTLADTFEAVVGAIFLDGGYEVGRAFILKQFESHLGELQVIPSISNPKGELQELLQAASADPPAYRLENARGPDHDRIFECTVHHAGKELGRGSGKNKKEAESNAALAALSRLKL